MNRMFASTEIPVVGSRNHKAYLCTDMGRSRPDGRTVRRTSSADVVGVLMGHHGAGDLLRYVWNSDGCLCIFRAH